MVFLKRDNTQPTHRLDLDVGEYPWRGIAKNRRVAKKASSSRISERDLDLLKDLIEEIQPDMIGMTGNTPLWVQSVRVTRFLKSHFDVSVACSGFRRSGRAPERSPR